MKSIVFARINRRRSSDTPLSGESSFSREMRVLAESGLTSAVQRGRGTQETKTWHAGDFAVTPDGQFLTGILGYSEPRTDMSFDEESRSWAKGEAEDRDTGSDQTIAPFAVALGDHDRWVAFATASRLKRNQFRKGFEMVLQAAVAEVGFPGYEWEVDLIATREDIYAWIEQHPEVKLLIRTVKLSNPGNDIDEDREEMRELRAKRKTEEFAAYRGEHLNTESEEFAAKIDGTETGFLTVRMEARGETARSKPKFNSNERAHTIQVEAANRDEVQEAVLRELAGRLSFLRDAAARSQDLGD
ncbi:hypothetical protein [Ornithinimicrobium sediminis]|uniref:hypothetical protein n=1 Tax=Ornithinimicrobium sediminis TaxID=2904603 RepID=UPI001E44C921|nr:hypothetical protein [Ornithinimicrobium sediminis]MCE0488138.1 hypothetical protein [Ornithinimicrobium sediminis]